MSLLTVTKVVSKAIVEPVQLEWRVAFINSRYKHSKCRYREKKEITKGTKKNKRKLHLLTLGRSCPTFSYHSRAPS